METFIRTIVLTKLVITMKYTKNKPNKKRWDREWTASEDEEFKKKEEARHKNFKRMKPEQQKIYVKSLMNRGQKKQEIKKQIIDIISTEKNLALVDIQERLGLHRNTFNYWVGMLEDERKRLGEDVKSIDLVKELFFESEKKEEVIGS